ncbi:hypothetical protein SORBI_3001G319350 [Sorghum bicolor]|uniref:Uncharacterized protein n=1 Tax=Sorghum bicolor TaxID=4558 RepID=A0A1Z5S8K1_SORBI|nr:hypothetical protein SORBI_3001G319350 [Sorghum bicolor]
MSSAPNHHLWFACESSDEKTISWTLHLPTMCGAACQHAVVVSAFSGHHGHAPTLARDGEEASIVSQAPGGGCEISDAFHHENCLWALKIRR